MFVWIFNERPFKILIFIVAPSWDMHLHLSSLWFLSTDSSKYLAKCRGRAMHSLGKGPEGARRGLRNTPEGVARD